MGSGNYVICKQCSYEKEFYLGMGMMYYDLERLISKVSTTRISPRECNQLKLSLQSISPIKNPKFNVVAKIIKKAKKTLFDINSLLW